MEPIMRLAMYVGVGAILLWLNAWYVKNAFYAFIGEKEPDLIAPFAIVGKDDPEGNIGTALSHMLRSRLGRIKQEVDASRMSLEAAKQTQRKIGMLRPLIDTARVESDNPLPVPDQLFQQINLELEVGGVAVGSLLSTMHRLFSRHRLVEVTVEYTESNAVTAASFGSSADRQLWITTGKSNEELISALAYTLWKSRLSKSIAEIEAFSPNEFQSLMETLHAAAELEKRNAVGRVSREEWRALLPAINELANRTPNWLDLLRIAKSIADKSAQDTEFLRFALAERTILESMIELLQSERATIADGDVAALEDIRKRIETLQSAIDDVDAAMLSRSQAKQMADLAKRGLARTELETPAAAVNDAVLKALGAKDVGGDGNGVKIAIVGGVPNDGLISASTVVHREASITGDDELNDYVSAIASTVRILAPSVKFVFFPMDSIDGAVADSEILLAVDELAQARPDILMYPLTLSETSQQALTRLATSLSIPVLVAAGNEPGNPPFSDKQEFYQNCIVVSAVDRDGRRAAYSPHGDMLFWSLGEGVPVKLPDGQQSWNGTGPATGLATGLVARILADQPGITVNELTDVLRATATPINTNDDGQHAVLNLKRALASLSGGDESPE